MYRIIVSILIIIPFVFGGKCKDDSSPGTICTISTGDLSPSQFGYAKEEVKCKIGLLESFSKSDLKKYLSDEKRRLQIVIGPDAFYILDGHHLSKAVMDADIDEDDKVVYAVVKDNWRNLSDEEFLMNLVVNNYIWLYDEKGTAPIAPEHFPETLNGMMRDPFRALAWMVNDAGGFAKVGDPFEDFIWSNFFREQIPIESINTVHFDRSDPFWSWCQVSPYSSTCLPDEEKALEKALPIAIELARSPLASNLPGFGQGMIDPPNCGNDEDIVILKYFKNNPKLL